MDSLRVAFVAEKEVVKEHAQGRSPELKSGADATTCKWAPGDMGPGRREWAPRSRLGPGIDGGRGAITFRPGAGSQGEGAFSSETIRSVQPPL